MIINTIAIDGPAASGKSTLGKKLADELGYLFFDTGILYRAVTWAVLQQDIKLEDEAQIEKLAEEVEIDVQPASVDDGRAADVLVENQDVTWELRRTDVEHHVSVVSAYPGVRAALIKQQRRIGRRGRVVMVGRDIGTVVLPEADLKVYLDASVEERARRRYEEQIERNQAADLQAILADLQRRDAIDTQRLVAPLRAAEDAYRIQSDSLDAEEVFQQVLSLVRQAQKATSD